jgi:parallel beta-helix repeat protein
MNERPIGRNTDSEKLTRQRRRALERRARKQSTTAEKALVSGAALALGVGLGLAPAAGAATFTVTNLNDSGAGSLRDAIGQANAAAGADTITFQAGLTGTITLTTGQLSIIDSVDIQGPGSASLAVDGNNASRVFYLYNPSATIDVTISGLTISGGNASIGAGIVDFDENLTLDHVAITGNHASSDGGGLWMDGFNFAATIRDTTISGNISDAEGGGVYVEDTGGLLLFQRTVISNNQAAGSGGGVYFYDPDQDITFEDSTISGNTAGGIGGGIYLYSPDNGMFTIRGTTISGNSAAAGGGLFLYSADHPFLIENSTISGNHATAGSGGGIYFYNLYNVTIRNSTIAGNDATGSGGGIYLYNSENTLTVENSIIAGNVAGKGNPDLDGGGAFDLSYTLVQTPGTASINDNGGNLLGQDPLLGPLGNHGGPTQTQLPAGNSPVVNAGDPAFTPPPSTDQRGFARVAGGRIDMGAVELNPGTIQLAVSAANVAEAAGTVTITVTRTGGADGAVSVSYATSDGTATAPGDYGSASGTVNFADQDSASKTFMVTIVNDTLQETNETFNVTLTNPTGGAALGATTVETVTILDDDVAPVPTLGDLGKALLAGLLAVGGLMLMRRRRGLAAPLVALSLTLGGVQAADAKGSKDVKATALSQVQVAAAGVTLRLADGTTLSLPLGSVEVSDRRHHQKGQPLAGGIAGLPANQPVVIRIKHAADGSVEGVKILVFDTQQAAQAALERKGK